MLLITNPELIKLEDQRETCVVYFLEQEKQMKDYFRAWDTTKQSIYERSGWGSELPEYLFLITEEEFVQKGGQNFPLIVFYKKGVLTNILPIKEIKNLYQ
jgi:hypothetical protein